MKKVLIFLVATAFVMGSVVPVLAETEWNFSGRIRTKTSITEYSKEAANNGHPYSDSDLGWGWSGARFRVKAKNGPIGAQADITTSGDNFSVFWGNWDFGAGALEIGRNWMLTDVGGPKDTYGAVGNAFGGARDQLKLTFPIGAWTIKVAGYNPNTGTLTIPGQVETDTSTPMLEASVGGSLGPVKIYVAGGSNTYDAVDGTNAKVGVDSSIIIGKVSYKTGPFDIGGSIYKSTNNYNGKGAIGPTLTAGTVHDSESVGWHVAAAYKVNDMVSIRGGYGEQSDEATGPGNQETDDKSGWYINVPIKVTNGFVIHPEYNVTDYEDYTSPTGVKTTNQGEKTVIGIKWEITF